MKCIYDPGIDCVEGLESVDESKCRSCPIYEAIVEGSKGCGSVEF